MEMNTSFKGLFNLNQNLWGLVVGFSGLGVSEKFSLCWLFWCAIVVSIGMMVSLAFTMVAYTNHYCEKKTKKQTVVGR